MDLKKTGDVLMGCIHLAAEGIHWLNNVNTITKFRHRHEARNFLTNRQLRILKKGFAPTKTVMQPSIIVRLSISKR
jgi:hypothetical protein